MSSELISSAVAMSAAQLGSLMETLGILAALVGAGAFLLMVRGSKWGLLFLLAAFGYAFWMFAPMMTGATAGRYHPTAVRR